MQKENITNEMKFVTVGPFADYMERATTAKYLNVSLPTFDLMLAQSRSGKLKPAIPCLRLSPNGKPLFRKSKIDEWLELRELSRKD